MTKIRFVIFALSPLLLSGQALSEGEKLYARQCAGCHGSVGEYTDLSLEPTFSDGQRCW